MSELNQFAISKALGSTFREAGQMAFGNFPSQAVAAKVRDAFLAADTSNDPPTSYGSDAKIVAAFEQVRDGAPTDELLWNKKLAKRFARECKNAHLEGTQGFFVRRLINVRKNSVRYRAHGVEISPTTKSEMHPSIVSEHAHVIEFALVKLRFRYGASIDDILLEPNLGEAFEDLAQKVAPSLSSEDLRLGALYIRKNRVIDKKQFDQLLALNTAKFESKLDAPLPLSSLRAHQLPASPGILEIKEDSRYLYISHNKNIQAAADQFRTGEAFRIVGNSIWTPALDVITLQFAAGDSYDGTSMEKWERKLVYDREPVFNWPMPKKAA